DPAGRVVGSTDQAATPAAQVQKLDNLLRGFSGRAVQHRDLINGLKQQIERTHQERSQLEADAQKPFEYAGDYEDLLKDLEQVEDRLAKGDTSEDGATPVGDDFDDDLMDETDYARPGLSKSL